MFDIGRGQVSFIPQASIPVHPASSFGMTNRIGGLRRRHGHDPVRFAVKQAHMPAVRHRSNSARRLWTVYLNDWEATLPFMVYRDL